MELEKILYYQAENIQSGYLNVSEKHSIFWETSGNQHGKPVLILHGGPGSGSSPFHRRVFDPSYYYLVQFDQRGSGRSLPSGCVEENTTWDLVKDCEKIREFLQIDKWYIVFGGSWGSALGLAYSESFNHRLENLIVCSIYLSRSLDLNFVLNFGMYFYPEYYEEFISIIPEEERYDLLKAYHSRVHSLDKEISVKYSRAWYKWELCNSSINLNVKDLESIDKGLLDDHSVRLSKLETHYFLNKGFFEEEQLLKNSYKLSNIPVIIVHSRHDLVCPFKNAYDLHEALKSNSELKIAQISGHTAKDIDQLKLIIEACNQLKK